MYLTRDCSEIEIGPLDYLRALFNGFVAAIRHYLPETLGAARKGSGGAVAPSGWPGVPLYVNTAKVVESAATRPRPVAIT